MIFHYIRPWRKDVWYVDSPQSLLPAGSAVEKKTYRLVLLVINRLIFILILSLWTQELYLHTRSSIRGERRSLPSWTCRGLELPVQILARCANPSLIHTNLAFNSILTRATPVFTNNYIKSNRMFILRNYDVYLRRKRHEMKYFWTI